MVFSSIWEILLMNPDLGRTAPRFDEVGTRVLPLKKTPSTVSARCQSALGVRLGALLRRGPLGGLTSRALDRPTSQKVSPKLLSPTSNLITQHKICRSAPLQLSLQKSTLTSRAQRWHQRKQRRPPTASTRASRLVRFKDH